MNVPIFKWDLNSWHLSLILAKRYTTFHFTEKIEKLKEKEENAIKEDPLKRLKKRMANNKSIFILKTVNKTTLLTAFKKIKKKKSSGSDGLTQEQLAFGMEELADPLQKIFNESILSV